MIRDRRSSSINECDVEMGHVGAPLVKGSDLADESADLASGYMDPF